MAKCCHLTWGIKHAELAALLVFIEVPGVGYPQAPSSSYLGLWSPSHRNSYEFLIMGILAPIHGLMTSLNMTMIDHETMIDSNVSERL